MYIDWSNKEYNEFVRKTGIFPTNVLIRRDVFDKFELELNSQIFGMFLTDISTFRGINIQPCEFAEKEFTFYKL